MKKTKVRVTVECFLEDIHDLDTTGFAYMEGDADEKTLDELAQIKLANFLLTNGQFCYSNVKNLERVEN